MKTLVLGCGSIGLRHLAHLRRLGISDINAADPLPAARARAQAQGIRVEPDPDKALERRPDVVLVCTPAATHVPLVSKALDVGAHVFVEKPLSTTLKGLERLREQVRVDGRVVQVGYNLRYHPAIRAMKAVVDSGRLGRVLSAHAEFGLYLPRWWAHRDYRQSYMVNARLGGGLLLDASHELDTLMWCLGKVRAVAAFGGKLSALAIEGDDVIKVVMKMANGALASLHLDCLQPTYTRTYTFVGEGAAIRWDCPRGRFDRSLGRLRVCDRASERFQPVQVEGDPRDTYVEELRDFFLSVKTTRPAAVGLEQGIGVLKVAMAIQDAIRSGRSVSVSM